MSNYPNKVSDERKQIGAIGVMGSMLQDYAKEKGIPFEEAIRQFVFSKTFEALFDLETGFWREGPTCLRAWYDEEEQSQREK